MKKSIIHAILSSAIIGALSFSFVANSQVINPNPPAQAGNGLSQAGSTLSVVYGSTANTAKEGNAVSSVAQGGTGLATIPADGVLVGNGTANVSALTPGAAGTVITSNGAGAAPSYQVPPTALVSSVFGQTGAVPDLSGAVTTSGSSVTHFGSGGTNTQYLQGSAAGTPSYQTPVITSLESGPGAGGNLPLVGNATATGAPSYSQLGLSALAPSGTAGQVLTSTGATTAPSYQTPAVTSVYSQTGAIPDLSGAVTTSGSSVTTFTPAGTAGQVLTSNGASAPTFQGIPTAAIIPSVSKLTATIAASSATATFNAQNAVLVNTSNAATLINNISASVNLATVGAGGMDVGTAPASGFVAIYYIFNGTTVSTLAQDVTANTSITETYTGSNMPSGYSYSALATVLLTNSGSTFDAADCIGRDVMVAYTNFFNVFSVVGPTAYTITQLPKFIKKLFLDIGLASSAPASSVLSVGTNYHSSILTGQCRATTDYATAQSCIIDTLNSTIYYYTSGSISGGSLSYNGYSF